MKNTEKTPESQVVIRFPDCDPFNHLNNSRYIDYLINAREDHLLKFYDLDIYRMAKETGLAWVTAQNQIAYLIPAEVMETVTVQTSILSFNEKTLLVELLMWNRDKTCLKAIMWSVFAHYNLGSKKSHIHSEELTQFFGELVNPLDKKISFEERVGLLKQINYKK